MIGVPGLIIGRANGGQYPDLGINGAGEIVNETPALGFGPAKAIDNDEVNFIGYGFVDDH